MSYDPIEEHIHEFDMTPTLADKRAAYNFCAGPCVLPHAVLDIAQKEMFDYRGTGQSVMELSHRQDEFRYINIMTKREIKKFLRVPDNFVVMMQQGGATQQYTSVVKNLINLKPHKKAMIMRQGMWSN